MPLNNYKREKHGDFSRGAGGILLFANGPCG